MAFGGHIADVAREGIWASLTGGWYYDPAHSLLCNTLHLYIWMLLLILPFLFGISSRNDTDVHNTFNFKFAIFYLCILLILFVVIKVAVSFLHHIFDTNQPIKYKSKSGIDDQHEVLKRNLQRGRFSGSSFSATRATESNALDTIEMLELNQRLSRQTDVQINHSYNANIANFQAQSASPFEINPFDGGSTSIDQKAEAIDGEHNTWPSFSFGNNRIRRKTASIHHSHRSFRGLSRKFSARLPREREESTSSRSASSSSSTSSKYSANGLLELTNGKKYRVRKCPLISRKFTQLSNDPQHVPLDCGSDSTRFRRGNFDQLAERPKISQEQLEKGLLVNSEPSPNSITRRRSMPVESLSYSGYGHHWRNYKSEQELKMSNEATCYGQKMNSTAKVLELKEEYKGQNKKVSCCSLFCLAKSRSLDSHLNVLNSMIKPRKRTNVQQLNAFGTNYNDGEGSTKCSSAFIGKSRMKASLTPRKAYKDDKRINNTVADQPCCSSSLLPSSLAQEKILKEPPILDKKSRKKLLSNPPVKSDSIRVEKSTDLVSCHQSGDDLKDQITKFLEELIALHPEAIDAIESVRTNRLIQLGAAQQHKKEQLLESSKELPQSHKEQIQKEIVENSFNDEIRKHHHVASDPTDTSSGAVHTFQDELGNWFTYWFGAKSSGIAQPLISAASTDSKSLDQEKEENSCRSSYYRPLTKRITNSLQEDVVNSSVKSSSLEDKGAEENEEFSKMADDPNFYREQPTVVNVIDTTTRDLANAQTRTRHSPSSSFTSFSSNGQNGTNKLQAENSSSSDEANRYIAPINFLRASEVQNAEDGIEAGPKMIKMEVAGRPNTDTTLTLHARQLSDPGRHLRSFMHRLCHLPTIETTEIASRLSAARPIRVRSIQPTIDTTAASNNVIESIEGVDQHCNQRSSFSPDSPILNTVRLMPDIQVGRQIPHGLLLYHSAREALSNRPRLKYCYILKMPKWLSWWPLSGDKSGNVHNELLDKQHQFTLKLDRLTLSTLFDRNSSLVSSIFDIILAFFVGLLTIFIFSRHIYTELSLLLFAFVVAGAQYSLLKSVQPDASSPVHGFNWQVAYSRPAYFILLSTIMLLLSWTDAGNQNWRWQPPWLRLYSNHSFCMSSIDIVSYALLLLPLAFTLGLLPQINTLCMHLLEQFDMHVFGSTASLSLISSLFSITRSICSVMLLSGIAIIARFSQNDVINSIGFSTFIALTLALAYLLSRESSNPRFVKILLSTIWHSFNTSKISKTNRIAREKCQDKHYSSSHHSILSSQIPPPPKQLLSCCILTNNGEATALTRMNLPTEEETEKHKSVENEKIDKFDCQRKLFENGEAEDGVLSSTGTSVRTLLLRAQHDLFTAMIRAIILFGLNCTLVFRNGQPHLERLFSFFCITIGLINHHIYPQMRAKNPWKLFARPILRPFEYGQFEATVEAKLTIFEGIHLWLLSLERNIFYPLLINSLMTTTGSLWESGDNHWNFLLLTICALRLARIGYSQPNLLYIPLLVTYLINSENFGVMEENSNALFSSPLFLFFLSTIIWPKMIEFLLKVHFILCYIAPWQISWGSAFHAFAQPFSIPHSGLTLAQTLISSIISAPLNPFLGSSFFLMSYIRPVKFWERDYNTKRVDHSKLRLASQFDRGPMIDDSNLNSIFYEHLTRSLQKTLAGDLLLGRWGCSVLPGDCFILASSYLNCMVHLIEIGNGFVTFQLRGLEFRGTYCHQREMEAISEDWSDSNGSYCCCCSLGTFSSFLPLNTIWALRWLAWEVTVEKYVVDGYSISDNSAVNMLQVHELRRLLVTLFVKSIIFYAIESPHFGVWLSDETILKALEGMRHNGRFVDTDPVFCAANDEDYDLNIGGLSRQSFTFFYSSWISHCLHKRSLALGKEAEDEGFASQHQLINSFCFALSILGRRALGIAAYNRHASAAESFLFGMDALFKGDIRITHQADEWVFADPEILNKVIAPAIRMALKLHQDHFAAVVDVEEPAELYERIKRHKEQLFISHEHDPEWRRAILANTPSLLALRHVCDDGQQDDYKVIMLNKRHLDMRVIKLNRECVRAFWAGQQQELIFLRNKNPERGSIQNARQVLRNIINSSADQPIGYPIYVSPLTTSFSETHPQISRVLGPPLSLHWCRTFFRSLFNRLRTNFDTSGSASIVPN